MSSQHTQYYLSLALVSVYTVSTHALTVFNTFTQSSPNRSRMKLGSRLPTVFSILARNTLKRLIMYLWLDWTVPGGLTVALCIPSKRTSQKMDEIIPGLWIGDISSAMNAEHLKQSKVQSVVSVMRGKLSVPEVRELSFITSSASIESPQVDILQTPNQHWWWTERRYLTASCSCNILHSERAWQGKGSFGTLSGWHQYVPTYWSALCISNSAFSGRSTTIVAAYLMYTEGLDTQGALSLIRQARPIAESV